MKIVIVISVMLLSLSAHQISAISPWFTSSFMHMQHALERFTYCHSLEPITTPNMNATDYLVSQIKNFFDVADFDSDNLFGAKKFFDSLCLPSENYTIQGNINIKEFQTNKALRCQTMDAVMKVVYRELKRSAVNQTNVFNLDNVDYEKNLIEKEQPVYYKNIMSYIHTAWISSNYTIEDACNFTTKVNEVVFDKLINDSNVKRNSVTNTQNEGMVGTVKYYLDPLLSLYTRLYLAITTEAAQARMFVSSGVQSVFAGFGKVFSRIGRSSVVEHKASTTTSSQQINPIHKASPPLP